MPRSGAHRIGDQANGGFGVTGGILVGLYYGFVEPSQSTTMTSGGRPCI